jgi:hypothetical protein
MSTAVNVIRQNAVKAASMLFSNRLKLVSRTETMTLVSGTPSRTTVDITHWEGLGSLQYNRPTGNNYIVREMDGMIEGNISFMAYLPYSATPDEGMFLVDVDGTMGRAGAYYKQTRRGANVGGVNGYFVLYMGFSPND